MRSRLDFGKKKKNLGRAGRDGAQSVMAGPENQRRKNGTEPMLAAPAPSRRVFPNYAEKVRRVRTDVGRAGERR